MKAAILYLTHERIEYTKQSLESIIKNTNRKDYDFLLWDNDSVKETTDYLKGVCVENSFDFIFCKENIGLTTVMNNQMRIMNSKFDYDVFCHISNDVIVPEGWLDAVFTAIESDKVGLVGLNLENGKFPKEDVGGIELERLRPECNVGGMHFCIPKKVYDLIGGFQNVEYGYGQQDANYSLKVKLLPNDWWVYYLPLEKYKGDHLGLLNFQVITDENKDKELYHGYHNRMIHRLRNSGGDVVGGRSFRVRINQLFNQYLQKKITYEQLLQKFKIPESTYVKVNKESILETSLNSKFI